MKSNSTVIRAKAGTTSSSSSRQTVFLIRAPPSGECQVPSIQPSKTQEKAEDLTPAKSKQLQLGEGDEITEIRRLLKPPPIEDVEDWGIPPDPEGQCDPALQAKVLQFHLLKRRQSKHFNDTLMKSKAFRNPHIYAKLVDFVDIEETATNFPKHIWDPFDVKEGWYADRIAEKQKEQSEKLAASQGTGKRTTIAFESKGKSSSSMIQSSSSSSFRKTMIEDRGYRDSRYQPYERDKTGHHHRTDKGRESHRSSYRDRY